ncbi:ArsC family reductase [Sapientia aquatica]|uniref:ArsC family reductase n=1 Tax=Sapientia aquatica TaxID=1549640 RepID=A0A4R5W674_9BURK|nr:ArsC family reductase [Sapientia aquatica]TDK68642.1 ArsC family reductase [Sapientia aquatica]
MSITLYGIPNCDQVKKARTWLADNSVEFEFVDYKKAGISPAIINHWLTNQATDWQTLLNRRGTTWRKLSEADQAQVVDQASAVAAMVQSPSLIKRPVLVIEQSKKLDVVVGFLEDKYQSLFA